MSDIPPLLVLAPLAVEPAKLLIEKVSNAIGIYIEPWRTERNAVADAKAQSIKAVSEAKTQIKITALHRRAVERFIEEEAIKQRNMEQITAKALPDLKSDANPNNMENDWIMNFFDKGRLISNEDMQTLWARVLAGEANCPGTYSKRAVNFLSTLDAYDAGLFRSLCGFVWTITEPVAIVYDAQDKIYTERGIRFTTLKHLDGIGLLSYEYESGFSLQGLSQYCHLEYFGKTTIMEFNTKRDNEIPTGHVLLSKIGKELAPICGAEEIPGFEQYVLDRLRAAPRVIAIEPFTASIEDDLPSAEMDQSPTGS